jgi:hypothetical protein
MKLSYIVSEKLDEIANEGHSLYIIQELCSSTTAVLHM